jgi:hypothetical protein
LSLNTSFTDGRYAQLGTVNTFTANQTVPNLTANGTITSSLANFSGSNNTQVVSITQTGNNGTALSATAGGNASTGVSGRGTQFGVYGNGLYGVRGDGVGFGVWGVANISGNSYGVVGYGNYGVKGDGSTFGLYGDATTYGVYGIGHGFGVYGTSDSTGGIAGAFNATGGAKILSGQNAGTEVLSVASDGSLNTSGNLVTAGSTTIGSGTPITKHLSALFSNVAFNVKLSPSTCTIWPATVSGASDGDTVAAGMGSSLMSANIVYSAWATNGGVQVRICNPTGAPTTVGAGNIRVDVWKH